MRTLRLLAVLPLFALLGACNAVVLNPSGDVAVQQRDLLIETTALMLLVIIPVILLVAFFAWRYRQAGDAPYDPDWDHSTHLEVVIWAVPLLIIICIGAMTWMSTHLLDPARPLGRINAGQAVAAGTKPLEVEVVALDWKWLFIYPEYGIATINEMAAPVDREIRFRITASSVMNSFYIPALAGQIYAMPAMETQLHAVMNQPGSYGGLSANYSGAGFSGMHFTFKAVSDADFDKWVADAKSAGSGLDRNTYLALERPSENDPVRRYASVDPKLFDAIVNLCVEPGKMCMSDMAAIDANGGLGLAGVHNVIPVAENRIAAEGAQSGPVKTYVASICTAADGGYGADTPAPMAELDNSPLLGAGLPPPGGPSTLPRSTAALSQPVAAHNS